MSNGIADKVVLITGGSTGLGAETALAARGAKVAVAARRKQRLDEVVAGIASTGGTARAYTLDVTDKTQVEAVVAAVVSDFGRLDVLINNAGLMPIRPMSEVNTDEWDAMIDVNIKGVLYGIAAALPRFIAQDSGHIINLSSVAGIKVFAPGGAPSIRAPSSPSGRSPRVCDKRLAARSASPRSSPALSIAISSTAPPARQRRRSWSSTGRPYRRTRLPGPLPLPSSNLSMSMSTRSS